MAGEVQLLVLGEHAEPSGSALQPQIADEDGLELADLASHLLLQVGTEPVGVEHDDQAVAVKGGAAEHVDVPVFEVQHQMSSWRGGLVL